MQVRSKMNDVKHRSKFHYDKHSRSLKPLDIGERIRVRFGKLWKPAEVIEQINSRSYLVRTENGAEYRRNRYHLLKTNEGKVANNQSSTPQIEYSNVFQNDLKSKSLQSEQIASQPHAQQSDTQTHMQTPVDTNSLSKNSSSTNKVESESEFRTTRSGRKVKPPQRLSL